MRFIEDFRENEIGQACFGLMTTPPIQIPAYYINYAVSAYKIMSEELQVLENQHDKLVNSFYGPVIINQWHLSLESFINTLSMVASIKLNGTMMPMPERTLDDKFATLIKDLRLSLEAGVMDRLKSKIRDISLFNRSITRILMPEEKIQFELAKFSPNPNRVNLSDIFQALLIVCETFETLRYSIPGLDLMPNVPLQIDGATNISEKLSILNHNILLPVFKEILLKHKLKTQLNINEKFIALPSSDIFNVREIVILMRVDQESQFDISLNDSKTNIISGYYRKFLRKYEEMDANTRTGSNYLLKSFYKDIER